MIEETVLNYLNKKLTVPVFLENRDIEEYVVIGKTGSGRVNFANSATFFYSRMHLPDIKLHC